MGLLSRITRRRSRGAREEARAAEAGPVTGFRSQLGSGWGDDAAAEREGRDRRGHGTNYLVIDQFGAGANGGGLG